jgi:hypothetical protein
VGVFVGALLADLMGHPMAFGIFALVSGTGVVLAIANRPPRRRGMPTVVPAQPAPKVYFGLFSRSLKVTIWNFLISYIPGLSRPLRYRLLAVNYLRFGVGFGIEGLVMATLAYILKELFGERAQLGAFTLGVTTVAGTLLGLRWASELCLGPGLGRLSDRFGRGRLILGSLPVIVITLLLVGFLRNPLPLIAVLPFMFAATTALSVTLDAFAGDLSPPGRRAFVMSRYATWWDFGAATGPLLGYAIGILFGFSWVYMGAALILILGGILYLYSLTRRLKRETIALDPAQDIP